MLCNGFCAATEQLEAVATSSYSMLLRRPDDTTCCPADFEVLVQRGLDNDEQSRKWEPLLAPLSGRRLPLEVMVQCELGCKFRLRSLSASDFEPSSPRGQLQTGKGEMMLIPTEQFSAETEVSYTPPVLRETPYPPAARLGFFVNPALPLVDDDLTPSTAAADGFVASLITTLDNEHNRVRPARFSAAEISTTGSFVLCDVLHEDVYAYGSGPDVRKLLVEIELAADSLIFEGHRFDPEYGIWRVGVAATFFHEGAETSRLWPRYEPVSYTHLTLPTKA